MYDTTLILKDDDVVGVALAADYTIETGDSFVVDAEGISAVKSNEAKVTLINSKLVIKPLKSGKVILQVIGSLGCEYSLETQITIKSLNNTISIPNIIAIGSTSNARLQIIFPSDVRLIDFSVYDRWGSRYIKAAEI